VKRQRPDVRSALRRRAAPPAPGRPHPSARTHQPLHPHHRRHPHRRRLHQDLQPTARST
jgi:hypothetical protein